MLYIPVRSLVLQERNSAISKILVCKNGDVIYQGLLVDKNFCKRHLIG